MRDAVFDLASIGHGEMEAARRLMRGLDCGTSDGNDEGKKNDDASVPSRPKLPRDISPVFLSAVS